MKIGEREYRFTTTWLPNTITMLNLFSGFSAILMVTDRRYVEASWLIFLSMIFDSLDGNVARALKNQNIFGRELDSLADIVSFVVTPSLLAYKCWADGEWAAVTSTASFLYLWAGAYRLARFNVRPPVKTYFEGCPTPAGAVIVAMTVIAYKKGEWLGIFNRMVDHGILMSVIAFLMTSRIPYPKFSGVKFSKWQFFFYAGFFFFVLIAVMASLETAVAALFLLYLFVSPIYFHCLSKSKSEKYQVV